MQKTALFSNQPDAENLALAKKIFMLSLLVTVIYMLVGFKWFYYILFGATLTEWQYYFIWPIYRFSLATCLFFFIPWYVACKKWGIKIKELGWQRGNVKLGLILTAIGAAAIIGVGFSVASDPTFPAFYPMERVFVDPRFGAFNVTGYIIMEALYVIMYYIPFEFFFRGFSQFPLLDNGKVRTTWILLYSTAISTAVHYTDVPLMEMLSALAIGVVFGLVTLKTRSIWYVLIVHAAVGIVTDFICLLVLQKWI
ncbi:MAG TPA: CPBP family intramembrane glutamic endopeptidase [Candidatus Lokiarchaeia archaeon]|nr:CPBP family intramembrane glutamic endopeptidase [Candidatus Lokiarchaeia archaeon]